MLKSSAFNSSFLTGGRAELSAVLQSRRLRNTVGDYTSHAEFIEPNESMFETPTTTKEVDWHLCDTNHKHRTLNTSVVRSKQIPKYKLPKWFSLL